MAKREPGFPAEYYPDTPVYEVVTNSDLTEGRGHRVSLGFFLDEAVARRFAEGKGLMGSDAEIEMRHETVVRVNGSFLRREGGSFILGEKISTEAVTRKELLRQQALMKLTDDEREALEIRIK